MLKRWVMLGDSLTEWGNWDVLLKKYTTHWHILNYGIAGDTTFDVLHRLPDVMDANPERVLLTIGINDLYQGVPLGVVIENVRRIIETLKQEIPQADLYIQCILPVDDNKLGSMLNKDIDTFAETMPALVLELSATFLPIAAEMKGKDGNLPPEFSPDGVHLSNAGYEAWAKALSMLLPV